MTRICSLFILVLIIQVPTSSQQRYDIVINEIMADPSPVNGLPNVEWIELVNVSSSEINLFNWRIADANSQTGPLPFYILKPDSIIIICSAVAAAQLTGFGQVLPVSSFPGLDNETDQLYIKTATGFIIHSLQYSDSWYQNDLKREGGWTLELIDPYNPCSGKTNWKASEAAIGGSPGHVNSIHATSKDLIAPQVIRAYTLNEFVIILECDEPVDSFAITKSNFIIDGDLLIDSAVAIPPLFIQVRLRIAQAIKPKTIYHINARGIKDCSGNISTLQSIVKTGLPSHALPNEWIINEILSNPGPGGSDYIEFFHSGTAVFDAASLYIANRNSSGQVSSMKPLALSPQYVFPGEYYVATTSLNNLTKAYYVSKPAHVFELQTLPSFPDDEGCVIALDKQGNILDEVNYKDDWHFGLLLNTEGVALERIDPSGSSSNADNWHSAAATSGYGTPTKQNSQYGMVQVGANLVLSSKIISPDNDGRDDFILFNYDLPEPGYVANVTVFNARGSPVCHVLRNEVLGTRGSWSWDGLDNNAVRLITGIYIVRTSLFNLKGKKMVFKNAVILARPMN